MWIKSDSVECNVKRAVGKYEENPPPMPLPEAASSEIGLH